MRADFSRASHVVTESEKAVLAARNGKEALEIYRKEQGRIALVILDLIMPETGGKQCLEGVLEIAPPPLKYSLPAGIQPTAP